MDPDQTMKNARVALAQARGAGEDVDIEAELNALRDLSDAFEALDGWLSKGGYLPEAWSKSGGA